jgi:hypothetical protein
MSPTSPALRNATAHFDLEAEQAVLGAFFLGDETWQSIGETFSPEVFYLSLGEKGSRSGSQP